MKDLKIISLCLSGTAFLLKKPMDSERTLLCMYCNRVGQQSFATLLLLMLFNSFWVDIHSLFFGGEISFVWTHFALFCTMSCVRVLVPIYKNHGYVQSCANYHSIKIYESYDDHLRKNDSVQTWNAIVEWMYGRTRLNKIMITSVKRCK